MANPECDDANEYVSVGAYEKTLRANLKLKALLDKYGGHTAECEITRKSYYVGSAMGGWREAKCDCGYDEAMKGVNNAKSE